MTGNQYAFSKIKLSQSKYKKGFLYISLILSNCQEVEAIDFRYFVDDEDIFTPTKIGFRVKKNFIDAFTIEILKDYIGIDTVCCKTDQQKLHIRHMVDSYGESVDVRYFLSTDDYNGWSGKGVRFLVEDYMVLQQKLQLFLDNNFNYLAYNNLFQDKKISLNLNRAKSKNKKKILGKVKSKDDSVTHIASELEGLIKGS